jgi:hypothetical protein
MRPRGHLSLISPPSTPNSRQKMGLRDFLRQLKDRHRERSRARSETGPAGEPKEAALGASHPTGSTPNLRIGDPNPPTPGPSTFRTPYSNGPQPFTFKEIPLIALVRAPQIPPPLLLNSSLILVQNQARSHHVSPIRHQIRTSLPRLYKKSSPRPLTIRTLTVCGHLLPSASL